MFVEAAHVARGSTAGSTRAAPAACRGCIGIARIERVVPGAQADQTRAIDDAGDVAQRDLEHARVAPHGARNEIDQ